MSIYYLPPNALAHLPADIHADQIGDGNLKASLRATAPATVYDADTGGALADPGDAIGRIEDGTANSIDLKQSSTSLRPIFGRRPVTGRRNLFDADTRSLTPNAGLVNLTISAGAGPDGEDKLVTYNGTGVATYLRFLEKSGDVTNTVSFEVKADGASYFAMGFSNSAAYNVLFDLSTGTVHTSPTVGGSVAAIEAVGNGFYRCSFTYDGAGIVLFVWCSTTAVSPSGAAANTTGDGVAGVLIRSRQQELGGTATTHQHVVSEFDVTEEGVETVRYASFDFVDDKIATDPITGGITGQAFVAGAGGCYVTDLTIADGGTFEIGRLSSTLLDTWTNAPINMLPAVVGTDEIFFDALLRSGNFTDEEIARLEAYYIARGGKGLLVEGPEMESNGTFDTDTSGWSAVGQCTLSVVSGAMRVLNDDPFTAGASPFAQGEYITEVGAIYRVNCEITAVSIGSGGIGVSASPNNTLRELVKADMPGVGSFQLIFKASSTTTYLKLFTFSIAAGAYADFDNVSVKRLIPREEL